MANTIRMDPTRTTGLRKRFMAEMKRRFMSVKKALFNVIVEQDALGLEKSSPLNFMETIPTERQAWRFNTDAQKVQAFNKWFQKQVDQDILSTSVKGEPWTGTYVDSAYKQGMLRAYQDTNKEAMSESLDFYRGSREQFIRTAFGAPETISKLQLISTRTFEELKGVTSTMGQQMSRTLAGGLADGKGPREIAKEMTEKVDGITRQRALTIARTETIYAHAEGQLDSFVALGVEDVGIMAEWSSAGDDLVCPLCLPLDGVVMKVWEARGIIPRHPNCRCSWIPAFSGEKNDKQKTSAREIDTAFSRSMKAEGKDRSAKEARMRSMWAGKMLKVSPDRTPAATRVATKQPRPFGARPSRATSRSQEVQALPTDALGAKKGSQAAQINSALFGGKSKTADEIAKETGLAKARVVSHLQSLIKKGLLDKNGKTYLLRTSIPAPVMPPPPVAPPLPIAPPPPVVPPPPPPAVVPTSVSKPTTAPTTAPTAPSPVGAETRWGQKYATAKEYREAILNAVSDVESDPVYQGLKSKWEQSYAHYRAMDKESRRLYNEMISIKATDPRYFAVRDALTAQRKVTTKALQEADELREGLAEIKKGIGEAANERVFAILREDNNAAWILKTESVSPSDVANNRDFTKQRDEVLSWIPKQSLTDVEASGIRRIRSVFDLDDGNGGSYLSDSISMGKNTNQKRLGDRMMYVHEYGHHLSHHIKGFTQAQEGFYLKRTKGEPVVCIMKTKLRDGRLHEIMGKKDRFDKIDIYAGRDYNYDRKWAGAPRRSLGVETSSVGLEHLWKNPASFAKTDPEWFDYIITSLKKLDQPK